VRTHGFLRNQFAVLKPVAELQPDDIDLVAMPMFVLFNLASGITSVIPACDMKQPARADPNILTAQLVQERATRIVASPALLERLATHCSRTRTQLPLLQRISTGGGPVGPTLPDRLQVSAPAAEIRTVYGSTEAEPIACIDHSQVSITDKSQMREGAGLLVGRPVAGCDVRIIGNRRCKCSASYSSGTFASHTLATGHIGEIVVSGKHVLQGYADVSQDRETKLDVDGTLWHRTGDAGYFDALGRLWLAGRCDAAIHDARGEIYPFQVEYAVSAVPAIRRAALIADNGKRLLVVEVSARQFAADCLKMARCIVKKDIDRIVAIRCIPMDKRHGAKVDYPALRRRLLGPRARLHHAAISLVANGYRRVWRWLKNAQAMVAHGRL
jgi:acyl-CoA synthetase (AMP-forming)/AMP-acid ligase II